MVWSTCRVSRPRVAVGQIEVKRRTAAEGQTVVVIGGIPVASAQVERCAAEQVTEADAAQVVVNLRLYLLMLRFDLLDVLHVAVRRAVGEPDVQLVAVGTEDVVTDVTVQVEMRPPAKVEVSPPFVILDVGHDVARRQERNLLFRVDGEREGRVVDGAFGHLWLFDLRQGVYLVGVLHGRVILAFEGHLPVQLFLFGLVFLCMNGDGATEQCRHAERFYRICRCFHLLLIF